MISMRPSPCACVIPETSIHVIHSLQYAISLMFHDVSFEFFWDQIFQDIQLQNPKTSSKWRLELKSIKFYPARCCTNGFSRNICYSTWRLRLPFPSLGLGFLPLALQVKSFKNTSRFTLREVTQIIVVRGNVDQPVDKEQVSKRISEYK
jgi:hypothetical protein